MTQYKLLDHMQNIKHSSNNFHVKCQTHGNIICLSTNHHSATLQVIKNNAPCHGGNSTELTLSSKDAIPNLGPKETEPYLMWSGADSLGTS